MNNFSISLNLVFKFINSVDYVHYQGYQELILAIGSHYFSK